MQQLSRGWLVADPAGEMVDTSKDTEMEIQDNCRQNCMKGSQPW
jgi:hypothetical protein